MHDLYSYAYVCHKLRHSSSFLWSVWWNWF